MDKAFIRSLREAIFHNNTSLTISEKTISIIGILAILLYHNKGITINLVVISSFVGCCLTLLLDYLSCWVCLNVSYSWLDEAINTQHEYITCKLTLNKFGLILNCVLRFVFTATLILLSICFLQILIK